MPRDEHAIPVLPHNKMYYGEEPRTAFLDWYDAIVVELINGPRRDMVFRTMAEMREASYSPDLELSLERAEEALEQGKRIAHPLSLATEVPHFTFRISGISRVMTHQIVRARIGVTFAQKCTGDGDIRHDSALVPRGRWRKDRASEELYIAQVLQFKMWYSQLIDAGESIHVGRYLMPHCLSQFIYMDISLLALQMMYGKRTCPEQPSEWQYICRGFKDSMQREYPEFAALLVSDCDSGRCHWQRKGNNDAYLGRLYFPDAKHDREPWNPSSYLHQGTIEKFEDGPAFETRMYNGMRRVS